MVSALNAKNQLDPFLEQIENPNEFLLNFSNAIINSTTSDENKLNLLKLVLPKIKTALNPETDKNLAYKFEELKLKFSTEKEIYQLIESKQSEILEKNPDIAIEIILDTSDKNNNLSLLKLTLEKVKIQPEFEQAKDLFHKLESLKSSTNQEIYQLIESKQSEILEQNPNIAIEIILDTSDKNNNLSSLKLTLEKVKIHSKFEQAKDLFHKLESLKSSTNQEIYQLIESKQSEILKQNPNVAIEIVLDFPDTSTNLDLLKFPLENLVADSDIPLNNAIKLWKKLSVLEFKSKKVNKSNVNVKSARERLINSKNLCLLFAFACEDSFPSSYTSFIKENFPNLTIEDLKNKIPQVKETLEKDQIDFSQFPILEATLLCCSNAQAFKREITQNAMTQILNPEIQEVQKEWAKSWINNHDDNHEILKNTLNQLVSDNKKDEISLISQIVKLKEEFQGSSAHFFVIEQELENFLAKTEPAILKELTENHKLNSIAGLIKKHFYKKIQQSPYKTVLKIIPQLNELFDNLILIPETCNELETLKKNFTEKIPAIDNILTRINLHTQLSTLQNEIEKINEQGSLEKKTSFILKAFSKFQEYKQKFDVTLQKELNSLSQIKEVQDERKALEKEISYLKLELENIKNLEKNLEEMHNKLKEEIIAPKRESELGLLNTLEIGWDSISSQK